jgi:hypothetical protein
MIYFITRSQARKFAARSEGYRTVDCGVDAGNRRWAVSVIK